MTLPFNFQFNAPVIMLTCVTILMSGIFIFLLNHFIKHRNDNEFTLSKDESERIWQRIQAKLDEQDNIEHEKRQ